MTTAIMPAEGTPRAETAQTWVSQRVVLNVLGAYPRKLAQLVEQGHIRRRCVAGMRPAYLLEDALALRG